MLAVRPQTRQNLSHEQDHSQHGDDKACLQVRAVVSGLPSSLRMAQRFLMLQVCIDDSTTETNQGPSFVLGGYIGRVQNWEGFADDWQALLAKSPRLEYLKAREANRLEGQFKGWSREQRDSKLLEFVAIIKKYRLRSIRHTVNHSGFHEQLGTILFQTPGRNPRRHPALRNPGYIAVSAITCAVLGELLKSKTLEKVYFIFDEAVVSRDELESGYRSMMLRVPKRATDRIARQPDFRNDKEFLPLQAADLFAWHIGRDGSLRERGEKLDSEVWAALSDPPPIDASIDYDDLGDLRGDILAAIERRFNSRVTE